MGKKKKHFKKGEVTPPTVGYETPNGALMRRAAEGKAVINPDPTWREAVEEIRAVNAQAADLLLQAILPPFTFAAAARELGLEVWQPREWVKYLPGFELAYRLTQEMQDEQWIAAYSEVTINGLRRTQWDGEGNVVMVEQRQAEGLWKLMAGAKHPDFRQAQRRDSGPREIVVNFNIEGPRYPTEGTPGVEIVVDPPED